MSSFINSLVQLLSGSGGDAQIAPSAQLPNNRPPVLPRVAPIPMPRPAMAPAAAPASSNPLMDLFGGGNLRNMLHAAGAGMSRLGPTGGDPYLAFAQGFGGATAYDDAQAAARAKAELDAGNTAYERSVADAKTQREIEKDAADLQLKQLAEARQQKTADLANQKTAQEIRRDARANGITITQQLEIERIAQAAGENLYGEERAKAIDAERKRLIEQVTSGQGITGKTGGLAGDAGAPTATGPNGEKVILRDGQWVPM